jgi:hypothetical protein
MEPGDSIVYAGGMKETSKVTVYTRNMAHKYTSDDIPTLSRKAKGQKIVPIPIGNNIISIKVT